MSSVVGPTTGTSMAIVRGRSIPIRSVPSALIISCASRSWSFSRTASRTFPSSSCSTEWVNRPLERIWKSSNSTRTPWTSSPSAVWVGCGGAAVAPRIPIATSRLALRVALVEIPTALIPRSTSSEGSTNVTRAPPDTPARSISGAPWRTARASARARSES